MKTTAQQLTERAAALEAKAMELRQRARELARAEEERRIEGEKWAAAYFLKCGYTHANLGGAEVSFVEVAEHGMGPRDA